jgi:SAM-dependent methyltransferase
MGDALKKAIVELVLRVPPFRPAHMGSYIRQLYFWRNCKALDIKNFENILDAGCGPGDYALSFARKFPWLTVTGIDIEPRVPLDNRPPNFLLRQGSILDLEDDSVYDFIYCIDVLEHIPNNRKVLENFYAALKEGGYLYIHMPAKKRKRIFPDKLYKEFDDWAEHEHIGEHYELDEIFLLLEEIGYKVINGEYTFGFPGKLAWELDRMTDKRFKRKLLLTPFLKLLGRISVLFRYKKSNALFVLAQRQEKQGSSP